MISEKRLLEYHEKFVLAVRYGDREEIEFWRTCLEQALKDFEENQKKPKKPPKKP